jgi:hypothetical protein
MSTRPWIFLSNTFLVNTRKNFKKALSLITDHLAKLHSQIADATILAIYNSFLPLVQSYENLYSQWQMTLGTYEGKTQGFEERLQHFSVVQINVWRGVVFNIFPEHSADAKEIFYDDRKPFQAGTYEQRVNAFKTLGDKLATYTTEPTLVALSVEVLSAYNELKALRDAQQDKEGASAIFSSSLETARKTVCVAMFSNLGLLISKCASTPEIVANFFDLSLLRQTGNEPVIINGTIMGLGIINLNPQIDAEGVTISPDTVFRIKNLSGSGIAIIAYSASTANQPPGPGVQFTINPGETLEKTVAELGLISFPFFNLQNPNPFEGSWEIEIVE